MALWDIIGQACGQPVYRLWGGYQDSLPAYASLAELCEPAEQIERLHMLRDKGFRLCLDNFQVAAASLGTMEQLPFDEIKMRANAIRRAQSDPVRHKVLAAIIGLAHSLDMTVCAEGIEDESTFKFLKTINCDKMQGFLISEAVLPNIIRRVYSARSKQQEESAA